MIQIFFTYLILNFIYLTLLFDYVLLILITLSNITIKSTNIFKYKVNNLYLSILLASLYILFFIILLYILRIYNFGQFLDLKIIWNTLLSFYPFMVKISIYNNLLIISFLLLSVILFLLLFIKFHKFFIHHIFVLYLYIFYDKYKYNYFVKLQNKIEHIGDTDLCTYILYKLSLNYIRRFYPHKNLGSIWFDEAKISKYNLYFLFSNLISNNKYKMFINFSPIIFILYDCFFNNFILIYTYHYLLIYTLIMLIKRITTCATNTFGYITDMLWDIYYNEEKYLYALSKEQKQLLDIYLLANSNYRQVHLAILNLEGNIAAILYFSIKYSVNDAKRNSYRNNDGIYLVKTPDGKIFEEIENVIETEDGADYRIEYTLGEEWVLIIDKTN